MDIAMKYKNWRDLITPKGLQVDQETLTSEYGKFTVEPLEIGYGVTLGNALRRVLLSSLQGAAITSLHIDGVQHEFSTIPGVVEDVTRIVLNMKGVRLKMHVDKPKTLSLDVRGKDKQEVTAGDIITDSNVEILNPDHHLATLNEDAVLKMTLTAETGKGYVPAGQAEENRKYRTTLWRMGPRFSRSSSVFSSILMKGKSLQWRRPLSLSRRNRRLMKICIAASMSWNCRCVRPTA